MQIIKPTLQSAIGDLQRKKYIEAMKETSFGWKKSKMFPNVGCPSDLEFVSMREEPHPYNCIMDCKECWEYVLENKWGRR